MRHDPLPTFAYRLDADHVSIGLLKRATFPTMRLFEFDLPLMSDRWFLSSMKNRGYLPFHQWSLTTRIGAGGIGP